jgi:hypothetical protein
MSEAKELGLAMTGAKCTQSRPLVRLDNVPCKIDTEEIRECGIMLFRQLHRLCRAENESLLCIRNPPFVYESDLLIKHPDFDQDGTFL